MHLKCGGISWTGSSDCFPLLW
ncbi:hypothetical protein EGM68_09085 [Paenibacillus sp. M-152]|nr:hypothetical protein EGM68_09085 [Paenibacillus sp. M-152]